jgi:hypothetical protein
MADNTSIPSPSIRGGWRKSSYSNSEGGSCLEVLDGHPAGIPVRDSKLADSPVLLFSRTSWTSFIATATRGTGGTRPRN